MKASKNADGTYTVILPLEDASGISAGKVTRNGVQLYEYKNGVTKADFQIDVLGPVLVTAEDPAKNKLTQTIDLTTYLVQ
ncbi:MAG: hypothetical protein WCL02_03525 [bacterium]